MSRLPSQRFRTMAGVSMVELMIAMVLGLMVLAALTSLFAGSAANRQEMERSSRQIENGRFAMEVLTDDLRMAGFYGELDVKPLAAPGDLVDPCSVTPADWGTAIPLAIQAYDTGTSKPSCVPSDQKAGTDILVIRRTATCEAGVAGCAAALSGKPYLQVAKCSPENSAIGTMYRLGLQGTATFDRHMRNCTTLAGIRLYTVHIYYVSTNNGATTPVSVPTLKRLEFNPATSAWDENPMVEGIEELNFEYGLDTDGDGQPNVYSADPTTYSGCAAALCRVTNWMNVVTARVSLLARNIDASPNYNDTKTYTIGRDAAGADQTVTPGGAYRRHAYTGLVRLLNVSQRREVPP